MTRWVYNKLACMRKLDKYDEMRLLIFWTIKSARSENLISTGIHHNMKPLVLCCLLYLLLPLQIWL